MYAICNDRGRFERYNMTDPHFTNDGRDSVL